VRFCVHADWRWPTRLGSVTATMMTAAVALIANPDPASASPNGFNKYSAATYPVTASGAEKPTKNEVQPERKAGIGPYASRR